MCHLRAVYCMLYAGCTRVSLCDNNSFQTLVAPIFYCNRNGIYNENCGQPFILSYILRCTLDSGWECDCVSIERRVDSCVLAEQMASHG